MNIVSVDLGPIDQKCEWLKHVFIQARCYNNCPIYLITDRCSLSKDDTLSYGIDIIHTSTLKPTKEHEQFKKGYNIRDGLWRYAVERFFYLNEFIQERNLSNTFLLGTDCLIYFDIYEFGETFEVNYPNLGAPIDNDWRCLPSVCYINNPLSLQLLTEYIISMNNKIRETKIKIVSDMLLLGLYAKKYGEEALKSVPLFPEGPYSYNYDIFNSIFDGAALGQYVAGIPLKKKSAENMENIGPGYINKESGYSFKDTQVLWGKNKPYLIYKGNLVSINNLHIHSKRLRDVMEHKI